MQVVILCGGKGTRLLPKTEKIPKPLIDIGGKPILWHLMKVFSGYGHNDFILCLGYLGDKIKEYFQDPDNFEEDWNITFADTGLDSSKGERLRRIKDYIKSEDFLVSYGDDLSDVNIKELVKFHKKNKKIATLTAINPVYDYGVLQMNGNNEIIGFKEKPKLDHWINAGFFVFNKKIFDYIKEGWDLEKEIFTTLSKDRQLSAFKHTGFWKSMNTIKDSIELNEMWENSDLKKILWKS
jgi:glucose-1-phosphate cytidylyltransferase